MLRAVFWGCGCVRVVVRLFPSDVIIPVDVAVVVLKLLLTLKGLPQKNILNAVEVSVSDVINFRLETVIITTF